MITQRRLKPFILKNIVNRGVLYTQRLPNESSHLSKLMNIYKDLRVEMETRILHFRKEFEICRNYRLMPTTFFSLQSPSRLLPNFDLNTFSNVDLATRTIKALQTNVSKVMREHAYIHAIAQVESRKKNKLLHTLPFKKMSLFLLHYPHLKEEMSASKSYYSLNYVKNEPHISKRVKFII
jgi:hypothetical protein